MHGMADKIIEALPRLRRHAYMLMGSRERADTYVHVCLEILVEERRRVPIGADVHKDLFRFFYSVLTMVEQSFPFFQTSEKTAGNDLHAAIRSLPPRGRAALLLTSAEGFSIEDASDILGVDAKEGRLLLERAHDALHHRLGVRVLIIEDEKETAESIGRTFEQMGHSIVGIADSEESALAMAREQNPELVIADVWLNGTDSGIDVAEHVCSSTAASALYIMAHPRRNRHRRSVDTSRMLRWPLNQETVRRKIAQTCFHA